MICVTIMLYLSLTNNNWKIKRDWSRKFSIIYTSMSDKAPVEEETSLGEDYYREPRTRETRRNSIITYRNESRWLSRFLICARRNTRNRINGVPKSAPVPFLRVQVRTSRRHLVQWNSTVRFSAGNLPVAFEFREFLARVSGPHVLIAVVDRRKNDCIDARTTPRDHRSIRLLGAASF